MFIYAIAVHEADSTLIHLRSIKIFPILVRTVRVPIDNLVFADALSV